MYTKLENYVRKKGIFFIQLYKYIISPLFPPSCRFYPSCSQYSIQSIQKFGFLIGCYKTLKRIIRCNPWNKGGYDPVK